MPALQRAWARLRAALRGDESAQNAVRQRVAADLHDGPLQSLIGLEMRLAAARSLVERDPQSALRELGELAEAAAAVVAEFRAFQRTLSPPPVVTNDLGALARRLIEDFAASSGLKVRFQAPNRPLIAPPETCLEVVQILREALANVRKHAHARSVKVSLAEGGELTIEDDGVGFPVSGRFSLEELQAYGAGPRSIVQRVRNLGGALTLESRPGQGSRLAVRVPL